MQPTPKTPYPHLTFKPMGQVGNFHIADHKLQQLHPAFNPDIHKNHLLKPYALPAIPAFDADLEKLILSMMPNIIKPVLQQDLTIPLYHGTAFAIPKPSSNKLSLIINLAHWNASQLYKPPKFKLPSVYTMRSQLFHLHLQNQPVYFSKWDLSNFYWSLKTDLHFRFPLPRADGTVTICELDCLPFGWDKSPWLGQTIHQELLTTLPSPAEILDSVYIDDGLAMGPHPRQLELHTQDVLEMLAAAGFIISPKSEPQATLIKEFIGKLYTATSISNTMHRPPGL